MTKKHLVLMLLCCLIPIGIILGLRAFGVVPNTTAYLLVMLLCPLLHVLMMGSMHGEHAADKDSMTGSHADSHPMSHRQPREDARN